MKKWGLALLCAGILCLSACSREGDGGQSGEKETFSGEDSRQSGGQEALSGEDSRQSGEKEVVSGEDGREGESVPEKVVMTYQVTKSSIIDDLEDVERAVNEISVPAIGVEVEFKVIDAQEAFSRYPLWISNKEPVDLMVLNYQDITRYVDRGMLHSLDDILYEHGTDICAISEERYDLTRGAVLDRFTYGVSAAQAYQGGGMGIILPKRYVEETGFSYDPSHVYTPEELTEWFAALKRLYPDRYPLGLVTAGNTYSIQSYFMEPGEGVAGESTSGNLLDSSEMKIYDRYASEAYREFLGYVRQWYENGYLHPDGALTDYTVEELVSLGKICAYPSQSTPESIENGYFPEEMVCLRTTEVSVSAGHSKGGFWVIPATSEHAEAAMKFLNLMYADASVANLIKWGIQGRHYEVADEENGLIAWVGGKPSGYYNPLGLYGDRSRQYEMCLLEAKRQREAYEREAVCREGAAEGFTYSSAKVSRELDEIQKVITKYVPILESGSVDPEKYYPEFLEALQQAGMDRVVADKQRQLDAWLGR